MDFLSTRSRWQSPAILVGIAFLVVACGSKEPPADASNAAASNVAAQQAEAPDGTDQAAAIPASGVTSWSPEALEELLAPIALYPDPILSQVLIASTNPQEVLDAGNWVLENQNLSGKALDDAATKVGFTPPVRALVNFPDTLDMMCREMDWTTQLGEAFTADQAGVLDAVQRLRRQAESVGNLQTSPQMTVDNETQDGKEVIVLKPAPSGEVYVPSYDPVAVYAPATAVAPATTTTTTTTESTGHSTGTLITTGLLAFGAGMLVNEIFDDDDNYKYKYPNYGYGSMPYYPPYPYRPAYGNGYYPNNGYRPPSGYGGHYGGNYVNNGNVVINTGGNDYWNRYDGKGKPTPYGQNGRAKSPITAANPKRSDLGDLNKRQPRPMPADVQRPSTKATASDWKGKNSYAGAANSAAKTPAASNRSAKANTGPAGQAQRPAPKVQGSYKGGSSANTRDMARPTTGATPSMNRDSAGQSTYQGNKSAKNDRGYQQQAANKQVSKPQVSQQQVSRPQPSQQQVSKPQASKQQVSRQQQPAKQGGSHSTAMSGANRGSADRQASNRGKQSMPQGAHSKGGGGNAGGKSGGKKKR